MQAEGSRSKHGSNNATPKSSSLEDLSPKDAKRKSSPVYRTSTKTGLKHVLSDASMLSASENVLHTAKVQLLTTTTFAHLALLQSACGCLYAFH